MALNPESLQRRLCEQLCADVRLVQRPDGELMLRTGFEFPDGDRYPIHMSEVPGGVRLSDKGHTVMRISYDHDIDAFLRGSRGLLVERILDEERVARTGWVFHLDTSMDRLSDAVFRFGRALARVYDLTLHSRSRTASTFCDLAISSSRSPMKHEFNRTIWFRTSPTPEPIPLTRTRARTEVDGVRTARHDHHHPPDPAGRSRTEQEAPKNEERGQRHGSPPGTAFRTR